MDLSDIALFLGVVLAALYLGGPILVRLTSRVRTSPTPIVVDPNAFPQAVRAYFDQIGSSLLSLGFQHRVYLCAAGNIRRIRAYVSIYVHLTEGRMAEATAIYGRMIRKRFLNFATVSGDGVMLETSNAKIVGSFARVPKMKILCALGIVDLIVLYRVHLAREARYLSSSERFLPTIGSEPEFFALCTSLAMWRQAEAGYFQRTTEPGTYVPTWIGALIMTWKQLPPLRQILAMSQKMEARRVLREATAGPMEPLTGIRITDRLPFEVSEGFPIISIAEPTVSSVEDRPCG